MNAPKPRYTGRHIWCNITFIIEESTYHAPKLETHLYEYYCHNRFRPSARHVHLRGDCPVDNLVSSLHYGGLMFENINIKSTSLRPRAIWPYRTSRISRDLSLYGQQLTRATSPQSTRHDHAAEIETIWRSLSKDQRATYFNTGPAGEEAPKQSLNTSLGIVVQHCPRTEVTRRFNSSHLLTLHGGLALTCLGVFTYMAIDPLSR